MRYCTVVNGNYSADLNGTVKAFIKEKVFLDEPRDDKAKLLGYSGYKMKAMFQL